ncbi:MAG: carboxypeptidase-like regulatory domain-containing protein [Gammaproteobacteria bacterium]|jgi:hypothetical protein|nr:carboxypeptidase-like regulatory domain-containing protein [Gammaproteobacteria bacterium]
MKKILFGLMIAAMAGLLYIYGGNAERVVDGSDDMRESSTVSNDSNNAVDDDEFAAKNSSNTAASRSRVVKQQSYDEHSQNVSRLLSKRNQAEMADSYREDKTGEPGVRGQSVRDGNLADLAANATGHIRGRVLDNSGAAMPAVVVTASPLGAGQADNQADIMAGNDGWFAFEGLAEGEYTITASDPVSGNSSQAVRVATGVDIVDLVIPVDHGLLIIGVVTELDGDPVASARVRLLPAGMSAITDELGVYLIQAVFKRDLDQLIIVEKEGYVTERKPLQKQQWKGRDDIQIDIMLRPDAETATVAGIVSDENGKAVVNQLMQLNNASYSYKTSTDASGKFVFPDVAIGNNYHLYVLPDMNYERYQQSGLQVPAKGINNLEIVINTRGQGEVSGQFVSATGEILQNYPSNILVGSQSIPIRSGVSGKFHVGDVPAGRISLSKTANGRVVTSGPVLNADESVEVLAIVDIGEQQFIGTVLDQAGEPIGGANVLWRWELRQDGLLHESMRNAVTDANGRFALSGFSAVPHQVQISAPDYSPLQTVVQADQAQAEFTLQSQ